MPNNSEIYFSQVPRIDLQRSRFDRSFEYKTTLNASELIPVSWDDVNPGETITMDFSHVTRMTTPIVPVMDEACLDVYAFFVPNRLIWEHWKEFCGENNQTHWEQPNQYTIPQITSPSGGWDVGSLADYLGVPTGVSDLSISALPFRAYAQIYNDWFRSTALKDPCYITKGDSTTTGKNKGSNYDYVTDTECGAYPVKVAKYHDYFTSALPEPQCGPDVKVPLGNIAPVIGNTDYEYLPPTISPDIALENNSIFLYTTNDTNPRTAVKARLHNQGATYVDATKNKGIALVTDLSQATAATINQLRQAFAVQRYYEALARGGNRYVEILDSVWHTKSPDATQQRAEYLGGKRFNINMEQVLQTSATDNTSPQGNTAAYSCTINSDDLLTYSSTEHGILMVVVAIRTNHTYQQGLNKAWLRKKLFDFYTPQLANIGEREIRNIELYAQGSSVVDDDGNIIDDQVFGYQEAWAEYRYKPNMVTGKLRSTATGSLDVWHYADYYTQLPYLSGDWIDETDANVYRTLAVQNEPQFVMDVYLKSIWTRPMPLNSIPGLMDHH